MGPLLRRRPLVVLRCCSDGLAGRGLLVSVTIMPSLVIALFVPVMAFVAVAAPAKACARHRNKQSQGAYTSCNG